MRLRIARAHLEGDTDTINRVSAVATVRFAVAFALIRTALALWTGRQMGAEDGFMLAVMSAWFWFVLRHWQIPAAAIDACSAIARELQPRNSH
ncbi:MAG: hypothetical protein U0Q55_17385 [Vicinamibacterales bacterium]